MMPQSTTTTKSSTYALLNTTTQKRLNGLPSHPRDVLCNCTPCRSYRVLRVDAFCEGLIAGLDAAEDAIDAPGITGTMSGPSGGFAGATARPGAITRELTPTRRPPSR